MLRSQLIVLEAAESQEQEAEEAQSEGKHQDLVAHRVGLPALTLVAQLRLAFSVGGANHPFTQ